MGRGQWPSRRRRPDRARVRDTRTPPLPLVYSGRVKGRTEKAFGS
jgi:hypothetical protein